MTGHTRRRAFIVTPPFDVVFPRRHHVRAPVPRAPGSRGAQPATIPVSDPNSVDHGRRCDSRHRTSRAPRDLQPVSGPRTRQTSSSCEGGRGTGGRREGGWGRETPPLGCAAHLCGASGSPDAPIAVGSRQREERSDERMTRGPTASRRCPVARGAVAPQAARRRSPRGRRRGRAPQGPAIRGRTSVRDWSASRGGGPPSATEIASSLRCLGMTQSGGRRSRRPGPFAALRVTACATGFFGASLPQDDCKVD